MKWLFSVQLKIAGLYYHCDVWWYQLTSPPGRVTWPRLGCEDGAGGGVSMRTTWRVERERGRERDGAAETPGPEPGLQTIICPVLPACPSPSEEKTPADNSWRISSGKLSTLLTLAWLCHLWSAITFSCVEQDSREYWEYWDHESVQISGP